VTLSGDAEWPKVADAVIEAVVVCQETLSDSRSADGDDVSPARLFGGSTSDAAAMSLPKRHAPQSNPPTDAAADPAVALPTLRGDSPRPGPGARSNARRH
jgi:hypothetical protein